MWIILSFVSKSSKKNWQIFTKNLVHAHCVISGIMDSQTQKHRTQFCCTFCWRYICRSSPSAYLPLVSWASIRKVSPWLHVLFSQNPFITFLSHYLVLRDDYYSCEEYLDVLILCNLFYEICHLWIIWGP
jgi:hypothetical protein